MNIGRIDGGGNGPAEEPPRLEREIDSIRGELDVLVRELDRRRHQALDWRLQLRRHQRELSIAGIAGGVAVLVLVGWSIRRRRARRTGDLVRALRLLAEHPDALARAASPVLARTIVPR